MRVAMSPPLPGGVRLSAVPETFPMTPPRKSSRPSRARQRAALFATFSLSALLAAPAAEATTYTWATTSGNWNANTSWSNAPRIGTFPVAGDIGVFNGPGNNGAETVYLNGAEAASALNYVNTGTTTLLGGVPGTAAVNTLTLTAGMNVLSGAGAVTIGDASAGAAAAVNLVLSTQTFTNNSANTLTIANGVSNSSIATLTLNGSGNFLFGGQIANGTNALSLTKNGGGSLTLTGAAGSSNTGATSLTGGTVNLDYSQGVQRLSTAALTLNGVALNLNGAAATSYVQAVASTTVGAGATTITQGAGGNATVALGAITATTVGGTLNVSAPGIATTTSATGATGILGNRFTVGTVGAADWATGAATTGTATAIGAYTGYTPGLVGSGASTTGNYFLQGSGSVTTSETPNTLKISGSTAGATGESLAIDPAAMLGLGGGGLLFTGARDYAITGGTLRAGPSGATELVISQYGAGNLTINSTLGQSTGGTTLTKNGPGTLTLSGANTYTGNTYVGAGTLATGGATTTPFGPSTTASMNLGDGATLDLSGSAGQTLNALNSITTGGGAGSVNLGATTLTVGGATTAGSFGGVITGTGGLTKTGVSTQTLTGFSTYTGVTTISGGVLSASRLANVNTASSIGMGSVSGSAADLVLNGGTLQYSAAGDASTNRLFTLGAAGAIDGSGTGPAPGSFGALTFSGTGPVAFTGTAAHILTLTGTNNGGLGYNGYFVSSQLVNTFAPQLTDDAANGVKTSLTKAGTGTWALTNANNTYSGGTLVSAGRLNATGTGTLGSGTVTVSSGGEVQLLGGTYGNAFNLTGTGINQANAFGGTGTGPGALSLNLGAVVNGPVTINGATSISAAYLYFNLNSVAGEVGTINGQITGTGSLTIGNLSNTQGGALTLTNTSNNWTGDTTIVASASGGGSGAALIIGATSATAAGGVIPHGAGAGNVVFAGNSTGGEYLVLNGNSITVNGLGSTGALNNSRSVSNNSATAATLTLGDNNASSSYYGSLNNTNTNTQPLLPNTTATGTLGVVKIGSGTQTFAAIAAANSSNYGGGTTINAGTLSLDFSQLPSTTGGINTATALTNVVSASGALTLNGGTLNVLGSAANNIAATPVPVSSTQTFASTTVNVGASAVVANSNGSANATGTTLNLGGITRNAGGTLDITLPVTGSVTTTSTGGAGSALTSAAGTAFATVGGTNWATVPTTGTARAITALASAPDSYGAGINTDVATSTAQGAFTSNTLRFNTAGVSLDVSSATGPSTVSTGGILVTANTAGANAVAINNSAANGTAGALRAGAGRELVVINNGALNLNAPIVDSTAGSSALTISGAGTTTLSAANSYTGATVLNGGTYTSGLVYANASGGASALPVGTVYVNGGAYNLAAPAASISGLGSGPVMVNNNATLAGDGVVNNSTGANTTTINGGASVSPGTAPGATGILSLVSNTTFTGSSGSLSTYTAEVTAGGSDLLRIAGNLDLSTSFDQIVVTGTTGLATYTLLTYTGTLTGIFDAATLPTNYTLNYVVPTGGLPGEIDLVMMPVPEPGTWAALLVGMGALLGQVLRCRRQRAGGPS